MNQELDKEKYIYKNKYEKLDNCNDINIKSIELIKQNEELKREISHKDKIINKLFQENNLLNKEITEYNFINKQIK